VANFSGLKNIKLKVTDNLSGVKKYRGTIDGKWVLCEYDQKNDLLFYTFDNTIQPGNHLFKLQVEDDRGNKKEWEMSFRK
jgi:hypothetical protein